MSKYQGSMKIQHQQQRKARAEMAIPKAAEESIREFHAALCEIAPRVEGQRPDRLPYVRSNGEVHFTNAQDAAKAERAARKAVKATGVPLKVEVSPLPNPNGGSPWYQLVGYLLKETTSPRNSEESADFALL